MRLERPAVYPAAFYFALLTQCKRLVESNYFSAVSPNGLKILRDGAVLKRMSVMLSCPERQVSG